MSEKFNDATLHPREKAKWAAANAATTAMSYSPRSDSDLASVSQFMDPEESRTISRSGGAFSTRDDDPSFNTHLRVVMFGIILGDTCAERITSKSSRGSPMRQLLGLAGRTPP